MKENSTGGAQEKKRSIFDTGYISGFGSITKVLKGGISQFLADIGNAFICTPSGTIGLAFLSYGIFSLFIQFAKFTFGFDAALSTPDLISSAIMFFVGIPLLFSRKPLHLALQSFPITDYILFDFFSIRRVSEQKKDVAVIAPPLALLLGLVPAAIGIFIPSLFVITILGIVIFVSISFVTPEFPFIFAILTAPYLSPIPDKGMILTGIALITFISFIRKVLVGKRVYHFEIYDICILIFSIFTVLAGIFNASEGVAESSILAAVIALIYVPASSMIINRRLADCAINALVVSAVPLSIANIAEFLVSLFTDHKFTGSSILADNAAYTAYTLLAAIFSLAFFLEKRSKFNKGIYISIFILEMLNLFLSLSLGAWISAVLSVGAYFILKSKTVRKEFLLILLIFPLAALFLSDSAISALSSVTGLEFTLFASRGGIGEAFSAFSENVWFGIGDIGAHSANLILSLALRSGIFVAAIFIFIMILRLVHLSEYTSYVSDSPTKVMTRMSALAVFALICFGTFANVFADITVYYLFFSVFGVLSATLRIAKKEHDDRLGYYGDSRSADSSVIDIRLRK